MLNAVKCIPVVDFLLKILSTVSQLGQTPSEDEEQSREVSSSGSGSTGRGGGRYPRATNRLLLAGFGSLGTSGKGGVISVKINPSEKCNNQKWCSADR